MMTSGLRRASCVVIAVATLVSAAAAQAGPLEDLLFGRRNAYYYPAGRYTQSAPITTHYAPNTPVVAVPRTGYAPVTATTALQPAAGNQPLVTNYAPVPTTVTAPAVAATNYYAPTPAAQPTFAQPTTVYAPATAGCACGQQRTVNYFPPAPNYRTVYYRVPVTSFRAVTTYDPTTCSQVTALQPCTTYGWQARRVPARSHPFLSWLFHRRGTPRATPIYPYDTCAAPVVSGGTPTTITTPGVITVPGTVVPGTRLPADVAPSLDPNTYLPPTGASLNGTILDGSASYPRYPTGAPPLTNGTIESARPLLDLSPDANTQSLNGTNENNVAGNNSNGNGSSNGGTGTNGNSTNGNGNGASDNGSGMGARGQQPNPVPDPDAMIQTRKRFEPPRLINPRDRRASTGPAPGSFVLISWPDSASSAMAPPEQPLQQSRTNATPAATSQQPRNDSGWRSVPR